MQIPLTIKHTKKDLPFFTMAEAQLSALISIEFDRRLKEELKIEKDWVENRRCKCAEHPDIQNRRLVLNCKHYRKVVDGNKIIKESREKIRRMTSASILRSLNAQGFK